MNNEKKGAATTVAFIAKGIWWIIMLLCFVYFYHAWGITEFISYPTVGVFVLSACIAFTASLITLTVLAFFTALYISWKQEKEEEKLIKAFFGSMDEEEYEEID